MKVKTNYILLAAVAGLLLLCYLSLNAPMSFQEERAEREVAVKNRLIQIRQAERRYLQKHGTYCADFALLVKEGYLADSLQYIPYTRGQRFELQATVDSGKSGRPMPLMECAASYDTYLNGLDRNELNNLKSDALQRGEYPGLKIGDLLTPNDNAGNWE